jgi:hypothetical protein
MEEKLAKAQSPQRRERKEHGLGWPHLAANGNPVDVLYFTAGLVF